MTKVFAN